MELSLELDSTNHSSSEFQRMGFTFSDDVVGFLNYTDRAIFLDNRDIVILKGSGMEMITFDGEPV